MRLPWEDAEAAAQNTWIVFLQKAATIHKGESLNHWLRSVALGEARNIRKKCRRHNGREQPSGSLAQLAQLAQLATLCNGMESRETLEVIETEVQRLPEKLRVPFVLHCLAGKTRREVAQQLDLPEGTVASRTLQARILLQRRLRQRGVAPPSES